MKRLDPELLGTHLGRLLRSARTLCGSHESAEDLVQETLARLLSRPRWVRGDDELPYLMQALRNTFATSGRRATRGPHVVTTLEHLDPTDNHTAAQPEEAVIAQRGLRSSSDALNGPTAPSELGVWPVVDYALGDSSDTPRTYAYGEQSIKV